MERRVLEFWLKTSPEHSVAFRAMQNLGMTLTHQRRNEEADGLIRPALLGRENLFGPEHPTMLHCVWSMAGLRKEQARYNEAVEFYQRACSEFLTKFLEQTTPILDSVRVATQS